MTALHEKPAPGFWLHSINAWILFANFLSQKSGILSAEGQYDRKK